MIVKCKKDCFLKQTEIKAGELFNISIELGFLCISIRSETRHGEYELHEVKEQFLRDNFEDFKL